MVIEQRKQSNQYIKQCADTLRSSGCSVGNHAYFDSKWVNNSGAGTGASPYGILYFKIRAFAHTLNNNFISNCFGVCLFNAGIKSQRKFFYACVQLSTRHNLFLST
jgi:hypothetical protein